MTSCQKVAADEKVKNYPPSVYPITGLWEGTYLTDEVTHIPTYCSFTIYLMVRL
jgi:hypothetical protein